MMKTRVLVNFVNPNRNCMKISNRNNLKKIVRRVGMFHVGSNEWIMANFIQDYTRITGRVPQNVSKLLADTILRKTNA